MLLSCTEPTISKQRLNAPASGFKCHQSLKAEHLSDLSMSSTSCTVRRPNTSPWYIMILSGLGSALRAVKEGFLSDVDASGAAAPVSNSIKSNLGNVWLAQGLV
jgi:hypothetical protein